MLPLERWAEVAEEEEAARAWSSRDVRRK